VKSDNNNLESKLDLNSMGKSIFQQKAVCFFCVVLVKGAFYFDNFRLQLSA